MDEHDELMEDWDFDNDVLEFDPIHFPEPIKYLSTKWQRPLDHHEMHIIGEIYTWCRNNIDVEDIKWIDNLSPLREVQYDSSTILSFNPIFYYEPILYLKDKWHRHLTEHEMHIICEIYDFSRTQLEREEIAVVEWLLEKSLDK